jgi:hypothetical protein
MRATPEDDWPLCFTCGRAITLEACANMDEANILEASIPGITKPTLTEIRNLVNEHRKHKTTLPHRNR